MGDSSRRVSYADIARRVGYHRSTVGLALRNHPGIPAETRAKILKVAREMEYRPDPALSSIARYRRKGSDHCSFNTIALISDDALDSEWRKIRHTIRDYTIGVRQRAEELGFKVDEFSVGLERQHQRRVDQIMQSRGIQAVIVSPLRNPILPVDLTWDRYSAVAIGYSLVSPDLMRITSQHRSGASDAVKHLYRMGYRRIGLILCQYHDERVNNGWSAGFLSACNHPEQKGLEYAVYMPAKEIDLANRELIEWIREAEVDAVVASQVNLCGYLLECGIRIPKDLGFACLDLPPEAVDLAGIDQLSIEVGSQAVDHVADLAARHQLGPPRNPMVMTVKGRWVSADSVRNCATESVGVR